MAEESYASIPFFGEDVNQDICKFFERYEEYGRRSGMTYTQLAKNLFQHLSGETRLWFVIRYQGRTDLTTFDEIKREMILKYGPMSEVYQARNELRDRYQLESESVVSYVRDIMRLCEKLDKNMSEECKIYYVKRNLLLKFQEKIVPYYTTSVAGLTMKLIEIEESFARMPTARVMMPDESIQRGDESFFRLDERIGEVIEGLQQIRERIINQRAPRED